jgi:hypothetical protein
MYLLEQKLLHALTAASLWSDRAPTVVRRGVHAEVAVPMSWIAEHDSGLASQLLSLGTLPDSGFWHETIGALVCDRAYAALIDAWLELSQDHASRASCREESSPDYDILFTPTAVRVGVHLKTVEKMLLRQFGLPRAGNDCIETTLALGVAARDCARYGLRLLDRDVLVCALLRACEWEGEAKDKAAALHTLLMRKLGSDGQDGDNGAGRFPLAVSEIKISATLMSDAIVDCFILDQSPGELLRGLAPGCSLLQELLQPQATGPKPPAASAAQQGAARKSHSRHNEVADLDKMAVMTPTMEELGDLVLPPSTLDGIQDLVNAIKNRSTVLTYWSFAQRVEFGTGIIACFHGEPGVGKTFAARAVANEVGKALRVVRASEVQSSLVGVAEKNIDALFGQVDTEDTILVLDEADTLFSSRRLGGATSHDFYINSQVNGLLAAVDHGLCILADLLHLTKDRGGLAVVVERFARALDRLVLVALADRAAEILRLVFEHEIGLPAA